MLQEKRCSYKKHECSVSIKLQAWGSGTAVYLWILQNFQEHLFWRTSANSCFYLQISSSEKFCKTHRKHLWLSSWFSKVEWKNNPAACINFINFMNFYLEQLFKRKLTGAYQVKKVWYNKNWLMKFLQVVHYRKICKNEVWKQGFTILFSEF